MTPIPYVYARSRYLVGAALLLMALPFGCDDSASSEALVAVAGTDQSNNDTAPPISSTNAGGEERSMAQAHQRSAGSGTSSLGLPTAGQAMEDEDQGSATGGLPSPQDMPFGSFLCQVSLHGA